jgi:hypothetical protein
MGEKLLTDKDSINTQKATKLSVKCFRDYLCEQDHDKCCLNICNIVNGNHVVKFGKDLIYRTKVIVRKSVWTLAHHTQSHNTARLEMGV